MSEFTKADKEGLVRQMLQAIGDDPDRDGLQETPARVVKSWGEIYGGYGDDVENYTKVFEATYDQVICVKDIRFCSMCEHHMLPFFGRCHIAYIPNSYETKKVLGLSKFARIVDVYARRLQIQEQLTQQIASAIEDALKPKGVAVLMEAQHFCMMARGVKQFDSTNTTSCMLGAFRENPEARNEALLLLKD